MMSTVDFEADDLAVLAGVVAEFAQGAADLFERFRGGHFFRQAVGAHLHAACAHIGGEDDVFLRGLDVAAEFLLVRGMEIERAAESHQLDLGIGEAFAHVRALLFRQRNLDAVLVAGAQLDALEAGGLAVLDERGHVPILREVVGDGAEFHPRRAGQKTLGARGLRGEGVLAHEGEGSPGDRGRGEEGTACGLHGPIKAHALRICRRLYRWAK
jgi:hypothetical protein